MLVSIFSHSIYLTTLQCGLFERRKYSVSCNKNINGITQQDRSVEVSGDSKKDDSADPSLGISSGQNNEAVNAQTCILSQFVPDAKF